MIFLDADQSIPDVLVYSEDDSYSEDSEDFDDALTNHWVWLNPHGFILNAGPHATEFS